MHHHLLSSSITMSPPSSLSKPSTSTTTTTINNFNHHNNRKPSSNPNPNSSINHSSSSSSSSSLPCHHSPSATLDILILILVLFSGTFLISSYFSYIFHSLSLLLPTISLSLYALDISTLYLIAFSLFFFSALLSFELCCGFRSRKCGKLGCKGLKKAMEFDLQLQTEDCLKSAGKAVKEVDQLPWKGGSEGNPDYECLRAELRKMAPPNGRAVLLFRAKCGCPIAKLEGWSQKRGRKHRKSLALKGGGDHS